MISYDILWIPLFFYCFLSLLISAPWHTALERAVHLAYTCLLYNLHVVLCTHSGTSQDAEPAGRGLNECLQHGNALDCRGFLA